MKALTQIVFLTGYILIGVGLSLSISDTLAQRRKTREFKARIQARAEEKARKEYQKKHATSLSRIAGKIRDVADMERALHTLEKSRKA